MAMLVERRKVSPPQLAKEWGVATNKVLGLIKSGELRAINLASTKEKRPRYAIDRTDVEAFEQSRLVHPESKSVRRQKATTTVKDYFAD